MLCVCLTLCVCECAPMCVSVCQRVRMCINEFVCAYIMYANRAFCKATGLFLME